MKFKLLFLSFCLLALSLVFTKCNQSPKKEAIIKIRRNKEIKDVNVKIYRYEVALFKLNPDNLKNELKVIHNQYRFFIGDNFNEENNIKQISDYLNDPMIKTVYEDCIKAYPDLTDLEKQFSDAFTNYKYVYNDAKIPKIYTYISGLDFENPIRYADSVITVSLDMYLGANYSNYAKLGIPAYKRTKLKKEFIVSDCIKKIAEQYLPEQKNTQTILDLMIQRGKILFFAETLISGLDENINIGFTREQLRWCENNEGKLWAFFLNNKVLYSTDNNIFNKFMSDGPFTTAFSNESPARVGEWLGWQIVRSYMVNNGATLPILMSDNNSQQILNKSKYKPRLNQVVN